VKKSGVESASELIAGKLGGTTVGATMFNVTTGGARGVAERVAGEVRASGSAGRSIGFGAGTVK